MSAKLARPPDGGYGASVRSDWKTIPNYITFFRLSLLPVFIVLHFAGSPRWALGVFAFAMGSDVIDGAAARILNQRSKLGAFLDPLADKLLVFSALVMLVVDGRLPWWLLAIIAFRDGSMILGTVVVRRKNLELPTAPTRIGKYATFGMTCLILMALARLTVRSPVLDAYTAVVCYSAGLCVVVSTWQYFARFGHLFFAPARRRTTAG